MHLSASWSQRSPHTHHWIRCCRASPLSPSHAPTPPHQLDPPAARPPKPKLRPLRNHHTPDTGRRPASSAHLLRTLIRRYIPVDVCIHVTPVDLVAYAWSPSSSSQFVPCIRVEVLPAMASAAPGPASGPSNAPASSLNSVDYRRLQEIERVRAADLDLRSNLCTPGLGLPSP